MNVWKYLTIGVVGLLFSILVTATWVKPDIIVSQSERRLLAQQPQVSVKKLLDGTYMKEFESYATDQFPMRELFRRIKALYFRNVMRKLDENGVYVTHGYAAKLDYPIDTEAVLRTTARIGYVYDKYLNNNSCKVYVCIIPDKGYYLAEANGYPAMDYDKLFEIVKKETDFAVFIDITSKLSPESFYKTDTHWRQEKIGVVADTIADYLGFIRKSDYAEKVTKLPFYGVYYGMSALPLPSEKLIYLTNDEIEECIVTNFETGEKIKIYDMKKAEGRDPYEMFLSGPVSLITIDNPQANNDRELVIFRDSFGSSLAPLLVEAYSKITLVDIRYISPDLLGRFVDFYDADVLFLYSTLILNSSKALQ